MADVIYMSNDTSYGGTATRTIASASLDATATGGFFATQDLLIVDVPLVDRLDFEPVLGSTGWELLTVEQTIGTDDLFSWIRILTYNRPTLKRLHLLAHGQPGILQLGTGITPNALVQLARQLEPVGIEVVVWGCSVGAGANNTQSSCTNLLCSDHPLGQGRTLKGYGPLSKLVKDASFSLFVPTETVEFNTATEVTDRFPLEGIVLEKNGTQNIRVDIYKSHPDYNYKDVIIVRSAKTWVGESLLNGLFAGLEPNKGISTTAQIIFSQETNSAGAPVWIVQDWIVNGRLNINAAGISSNANGRIRYQNKNAAFDNHSTYSITSGTVSLNSSATANLFSGSATASLSNTTPLVHKQVTAADGSASWQAQGWKANGTVNIDAGGITAKANADVTYKAKDASYDNQATYTISSASLSADASGKVFSANVSATDVVLKQIQNADNPALNTWQAQSWNATGSLSLELEGNTKLSGTANVIFERLGPQKVETYTVKNTGLELQLEDSQLTIQGDIVRIENGYVTEITGSATSANLLGIKDASLQLISKNGITTLSGRGTYEGFAATIKGSLKKTSTGLSIDTLTAAINQLDSVDLGYIKDASISGSYGAGKLTFNGNAKLDFTPEDTSNNDAIKVSLRDLTIKDKIVTSASIEAGSIGKDFSITVGGAQLSLSKLSASYIDSRGAESTKDGSTYNQAIGLEAEGGINFQDNINLTVDGQLGFNRSLKKATSSGDKDEIISSGISSLSLNASSNVDINLGGVSISPEELKLGYYQNIESTIGLWSLRGKAGIQISSLPKITVNLGDTSIKDSDVLPRTSVYTPTTWTVGSLNGEASNIDLGIISAKQVQIGLNDGVTTLQHAGLYKLEPLNNPKQLRATEGSNKRLSASIKDVKLNIGPISETLKSIATTALDLLSPVQPAVGFFTQEITALNGVPEELRPALYSFIESVPGNQYRDGKIQVIELLDAAFLAAATYNKKQYSTITPYVKSAENLFITLEKIRSYTGSKDIILGDFSLDYALNGSVGNSGGNTQNDVSPKIEAPEKRSIDQLTQLEQDFGAQGSYTIKSDSSISASTNLTFPFIEDPLEFAIAIFKGERARIYDLNLGLEIKGNIAAKMRIPQFPVVTVGVQGGINAGIYTTLTGDVGKQDLLNIYDAYQRGGLDDAVKKTAITLARNTSVDLAKTKAEFGGNIAITAGIDAVFASLELVAGLEGKLSVQPQLVDANGKVLADQVLRLNNAEDDTSKLAYIQTSPTLRDLKLNLRQNLDELLQLNIDAKAAYRKNSIAIALDIKPIILSSQKSQLAKSIAEKGIAQINQIPWLVLSYKALSEKMDATIDFKDLRLSSKDSVLNPIFKEAILRAYNKNNPTTKTLLKEELSDAEIEYLIGLLSTASPLAVSVATVDSSTPESLHERIKYLEQGGAFNTILIDDLLRGVDSVNAKKRTIQIKSGDNAIESSAFYSLEAISKNPNLVFELNSKLNQPFNSILFDVLPVKGEGATNQSAEIRYRRADGTWSANSIGRLTRGPSKKLEDNIIELSDGLTESQAAVRLLQNKNNSGYNLIIDLSIGAFSNSAKNITSEGSVASEIVESIRSGNFAISFEHQKQSGEQANSNTEDSVFAFSDPRLIQGSSVYIGIESKTNGYLVGNINQIKDGLPASNQERITGLSLAAQPSDLLNPSEFYAVSRQDQFRATNNQNPLSFTSNGLAAASVMQESNQTINSLMIYNSINRMSIDDHIDAQVLIKTGTSVAQSVDPANGNIILSYIKRDGRPALAIKTSDSTTYKPIACSDYFKDLTLLANETKAPVVSAFNGEISFLSYIQTNSPSTGQSSWVLGALKPDAAGVYSHVVKTGTFQDNDKTDQAKIDKIHTDNTSNNQLTIGVVTPSSLGLNSTQNIENELTLLYGDYSDGILQINTSATSNNFANEAWKSSTEGIPNLELSKNVLSDTTQSYSYLRSTSFTWPVTDLDLPEFGSIEELNDFYNLSSFSPLFVVTKDNGKWPQANTVQLAEVFNLKVNSPDLSLGYIEGIVESEKTPLNLSVAYSKPIDLAGEVPSLINNWKGESRSLLQNFSIGDPSKRPSIAFTIASDKNFYYYSPTFLKSEDGVNKLIATANIGTLDLDYYETAVSQTAQQNADGAPAGLGLKLTPARHFSTPLQASSFVLDQSKRLDIAGGLSYSSWFGNTMSESNLMNGTNNVVAILSEKLNQANSGTLQEINDFSTNLDGWEGGKIVNSTYLGSYLTPISQGQSLKKTFSLSNANDKLSFTLYRIDSWDNERLKISVNGKALISTQLRQQRQTSFGGISEQFKWTVTAKDYGTPTDHKAGSRDFDDQVFDVELILLDKTAYNQDHKIEITAELDESTANESIGIDNFSIGRSNDSINAIGSSLEILPTKTSDNFLSFGSNSQEYPLINFESPPNYETGLILPRFNPELDPSRYGTDALTRSFFRGTQSFVSQGEWAPIGMISTVGGLAYGDLRAPIISGNVIGLKEYNYNPGLSLLQVSNNNETLILDSGSEFASSNGHFILRMQNDGSLVLYANTSSGRQVLIDYNQSLPRGLRTPGSSLVLRSKSSGAELALKLPKSQTQSEYHVLSSLDFNPWQSANNGIALSQDNGGLEYLTTSGSRQILPGLSVQTVAKFSTQSYVDLTPLGFNGLIEKIGIAKENPVDVAQTSFGAWFDGEEVPKLDTISLAPDLTTINNRDIVFNDTDGTDSIILSKNSGFYSGLQGVMQLGRGVPPSNRIKELSFSNSIYQNENNTSNLQEYLKELWNRKDDQVDKAGAEAIHNLLDAAIPLDSLNRDEWIQKFLDKYSKLRLVKALPAFSSPNYVKFPSNSLTPYRIDFADPIYSDYVPNSENKSPTKFLNINANFKVNAFVKVVASAFWWSKDLYKLTVPLIDNTYTFSTGLAVGGPRYGQQYAILDLNKDLLYSPGEVATTFSNGAFTLNLSASGSSIFLPSEGSQDWLWDGEKFESKPQKNSPDFRSAIIVVRPEEINQVTDAVTGLFDNRYYLTTPDTEGLVSNIWTSILFAPTIDYRFNYDSAQKNALDGSLLMRFKQSDPLFVSKLNPSQIRKDLVRLLRMPETYASGVADGFDYYNALSSTDADIQNLALEAFIFNANLSFATTALDRLLALSKLDETNWGQQITVGKKEDATLLSAYQALYYLSLALTNQLDPFYSDCLTAIAPDSVRLAALRSGTTTLELTEEKDLLLLFRFALAIFPNQFAELSTSSSKLRFDKTGRLVINWKEQQNLFLSAVENIGVDRLANRLAIALKHYEIGAKVTVGEKLHDPRLIPTMLAQIKHDILDPAKGIVTNALSSMSDDPLMSTFENAHTFSLDTIYEPEVHDDKRFVAITEETITELDENGKPEKFSVIALTLSEAAPAGGVVIPLLLMGNAIYGSGGDFSFKNEPAFPSYIYIPYGESSAYLELDPNISSNRDFDAVIGILDPSMSYNRSKDMDRVYIRKRAYSGSESSRPKLYDNDQLVRLNLDPKEPESFYSPSAFDKSFPFNFYKDSTVVGIEAKDEDSRSLHLYAHNSLPGVRRYSHSEPDAHPLGGKWLLLEEDIINIYEGDRGDGYVAIREYYNSNLADYYYLPSGQNNSRFLGSEWQDLGIRFSLRAFSPEIGFALGTLRTRTSSNLSYLHYPTRDTLSRSNRDLVEALGYQKELISDAQYSYALEARPTTGDAPNQPKRLTYSATFDTASFAGSLWDPATGLQTDTAPALIVYSEGQARDFNYDPIRKSGARFYSLNGFSADTVSIDGAIDDIDSSDEWVTLALNESKATLQTTVSGLIISHNSSQAVRKNTKYNVDLNLYLELGESSNLPDLGDYDYYLLPQNFDHRDSPSAENITRNYLLQSGLRIFQSSTGIDSYLNASTTGDQLFSASIQLPVGTELTVVALQAGKERGIILSGSENNAGSSVLDFATPDGDRISIQMSDQVAGLDDFVSRNQFISPGIDLLGLGKKATFRMDLSREASITSSIGLYRSIDIDGGVLDPISGTTIYPSDPGYKAVALSGANTRNLPTGITVQDRSSLTNQIFELNEDAVLFPYAITESGEAHFAFASANSDGINHFKTLGHNTFGYEDLPAPISDFDFDDILINVRSVSTF